MENNGTALLVMDMQMPFLNRFPQHGNDIVKKVADAVEVARKKNVLLIFVRLGYRKGLPEVGAGNEMFSPLKNNLSDAGLITFMQIHPGIGCREDDIIIDKKRISAFSGNDLEMILRANNIFHLILAGINTGGIVLSTFREAFDKDFQLTILSDGCADSDEDIHQFLIHKLFPKQGKVITIDDWKARTF